MPDDTQVLIIEMAMRGLRQIDQLAATALPDIAIIVNAGVAHLGVLDSVENIVQAKCELFEHLDAGKGLAIVGNPTPLLMSRAAEVFKGKTLTFETRSVRELEVTPELTVFELHSDDDGPPSKFSMKAHGLSHLQDAWCAIAAARSCGLDDDTIARGLAAYNPVSGRGNKLRMANGALVVDEAYNGNPDSVRSSVATFADSRIYPQTEKLVVLGELAELGADTSKLHRDLGEWLRNKELSVLITVGPVARYIAEGAQGARFEIIACKDRQEAEQILRKRMSSCSSVLVKASHSARLDLLVAELVSQAVTGISD